MCIVYARCREAKRERNGKEGDWNLESDRVLACARQTLSELGTPRWVGIIRARLSVIVVLLQKTVLR
jgi:hypothetical protein